MNARQARLFTAAIVPALETLSGRGNALVDLFPRHQRLEDVRRLRVQGAQELGPVPQLTVVALGAAVNAGRVQQRGHSVDLLPGTQAELTRQGSCERDTSLYGSAVEGVSAADENREAGRVLSQRLAP